MENHKHVWTRIALETTMDDPSGDTIVAADHVWKWCIRCGKLKLGKEIFTFSPHQKKAVVADK
jgi:hypothetical protein